MSHGRLALATLFIAGCGLANAGRTDPVAGDGKADPVALGQSLYRQNCARCHGFQMVNPGPGVFDLRTFPRDDKSRFIAAVSNGKGAMPGWQVMLSPEQIELLWRYVSTAGR